MFALNETTKRIGDDARKWIVVFDRVAMKQHDFTVSIKSGQSNIPLSVGET